MELIYPKDQLPFIQAFKESPFPLRISLLLLETGYWVVLRKCTFFIGEIISNANSRRFMEHCVIIIPHFRSFQVPVAASAKIKVEEYGNAILLEQ